MIDNDRRKNHATGSAGGLLFTVRKTLKISNFIDSEFYCTFKLPLNDRKMLPGVPGVYMYSEYLPL